MEDMQGETMPDEPREDASEVWSRRSGSNQRSAVYEPMMERTSQPFSWWDRRQLRESG